MATKDAATRERHWERTRNLTFVILALWLLFALIIPWFAKDLNSMSFLGFKLGYYMVVQGSLIAFVLMIFVQNWIQNTIDDEAGMGEE